MLRLYAGGCLSLKTPGNKTRNVLRCSPPSYLGRLQLLERVLHPHESSVTLQRRRQRRLGAGGKTLKQWNQTFNSTPVREFSLFKEAREGLYPTVQNHLLNNLVFSEETRKLTLPTSFPSLSPFISPNYPIHGLFAILQNPRWNSFSLKKKLNRYS